MNMNKKGGVEGKGKLCHVVVSVRRGEERGGAMMEKNMRGRSVTDWPFSASVNLVSFSPSGDDEWGISFNFLFA